MKWKEKHGKYMVEVICLLFVILFVYAAVSKLLEFEKFRAQLGQSPILTPYATWLVWLVPAVEILVSLMLLFTRFRLRGLYASFTLMIAFTAYIIAILNFSAYIPCSCGGILENMGWTGHLVFNIGFTLLAFLGIILYPIRVDIIDMEKHLQN